MKKLISILLVFLLLASLCVCAAATGSDTPLIVDNAGVLTSEQVDDLTQTASDLRDLYEMDVVIVVVADLDGKSAQDYADDYYDYNGYGIGDDYSGMLLLIATESRDWWISTCGEAIYVLTDYGIESIFSDFAGYLSVNDYYHAFETYLDCLPEYFDAYYSGDPIDGYSGNYSGPGSYSPGDADDIIYYEDDSTVLLGIISSVFVGCVVSGIAVLIMSGRMNTKLPQNSAGNYLNRSSYQLHAHSDMFLYSNVTKVRRESSSSSSSSGGGGGSSTHSSSSGRSHGGGGGKF
jgi:uncharacterized protein